MRYTAKHYFNFGRKLNKQNMLITEEGWDAVRCDGNDTSFSIPEDEAAYRNRASESYKEEVRDLIDLISEKNFRGIFSVGCGCAYLEYQLKSKMPELMVTVTDFNAKSIERLKKVLKNCDKIDTFNMMADDYERKDALLYLFFRIDTEITDEEWLKVYRKMHQHKVQYVLVVATGFLTFERLVKETIKSLIRGIRGYAFCGYIRTRESFETLWGNYYKIERPLKIGSLDAYLLRINDDE